MPEVPNKGTWLVINGEYFEVNQLEITDSSKIVLKPSFVPSREQSQMIVSHAEKFFGCEVSVVLPQIEMSHEAVDDRSV